MHAGSPVIALASGGPLETIDHEHTGFLCDNSPQSYVIYSNWQKNIFVQTPIPEVA